MSSDSDDFMMEDDEQSSMDYDSDVADENPLPVAKKLKAANAAAATRKTTMKKAGTKKTSTVVTIQQILSPSKKGGNLPKKSVEEMYQKKTQLEHILLRPDTYIGSVEPSAAPMYVLDNGRIVEKTVTYTPGLYKIYDEILVNAADNKQRDGSMDKIEINIDASSNLISVKNNGKGIPIVIHKEHQCYVPTMIFGHLLTGSNFDDQEKKTTGGRNGYGAKLANVFSTMFTVECVDVEHGLSFSQVFRNNMSAADEAVVRPLTTAERKAGDFVKISFTPDLRRFHMTHLDHDTVGLFGKRAYDLAGTLAVTATGGEKKRKTMSVYLNNQKLAIGSFEDYLKLYDGINPPDAYEKEGRWEVGISASPEPTMKQVSFVNAICTSKGGQHVIHIADQIANHLVKTIKKKNKNGAEVKPAQIKNHLCIFVNCLIDNPAFDSQTKEFLTTKPKVFGSTVKLSDKFLKQLDKSPIVDAILEYASFKDKQALKRKGGVKKSKLLGIPKLDDANFAGTAKSNNCTLIITEGDSAKSLAMSGLSVIGRDYYGVFPLKGKPMNVRDAKTQQVLQNDEIKNLVDIMGLKFSTVYDATNIKSLRYGHLMIMADQDTDGSHIKGLVINFIHHFWPSLLDVPKFLQQFITPIVKVTKGKKSHTFFSMPECNEWLESTGNNGKGWTQKYYKGLGTSTSAEAKEYFSNLDLHEVTFGQLSHDKELVDDLDGALPNLAASGADLIDMVFRKARVEDRKQWLNQIAKDVYLDYANVPPAGVKYSDFINREYILFSKYDNERSIPHMMDGFKPSQRKVLFACFKRKLKNEIKVAQLTGYVAEQSAYHHGEQSLQGTIVNMAQDFVGSNNINLLTPSGQFGTRRMGGSDSASARYIFTKLEAITRTIFHPDDDDLLHYKNEEGAAIEPDFYVPVIPMVLVNGADGIGTGWSSSVCNYNPREIVANIRRLIQGEDVVPMLPYYSGFVGEIEQKGKGSFVVKGIIERKSDTELLISELPVKKSTHAYKVQLEAMLTGDAKKPAEIKDIKENHTEATISFTIAADKEKIDEFEKEKDGLYGKFKLTASLSTTNMTLFDSSGKIVKYESPENILCAFFALRLEFYEKRKALLVEKLEIEQRTLSNKARFIEEVCSGLLIVSNRKRHDILVELQNRKYDFFSRLNTTEAGEDDESSDDDMVGVDASDAELAKGYEYLLGMKIWSLTFEKALLLREQLKEKTEDVAQLVGTTPAHIWLRDLDAIEEALLVRDAHISAAELGEKRAQRKNQKHRVTVAKRKLAYKKATKTKWASEDETSSDGSMGFNDSESESDTLPEKATVQKFVSTVAVHKPQKQLLQAAKAGSSSVAANSFEVASSKTMAVKVDIASDDEDLIGRSLMDRMKDKLHVSPPVKKLGDRSLGKFDAGQFAPASLTPAREKSEMRSKPVRKTSGGGKQVAKALSSKAAKPQSKQKDKKVFEASDSEDMSFAGESSEEVVDKAFVVVGGRARREAVKRAAYVFSDDDESAYGG